MPIKQLPVFYFGHLSEALKAHGICLTQALATRGYNTDALKQIDGKVPTAVFDELIRDLLQQGPLENLGLEVGQRLHIAHHGAFGLALLNAPTLRAILHFVADYIVIRIPFIELSIQETPRYFRVLAHDTHWSGNTHRFIVEAVSLAFLNLQKALNARGNHIDITRILFDYPDQNRTDSYQQYLGVETAFDQAFCGFIIDNRQADAPLVDSDELSFQQAVLLCEQEKSAMVERFSSAGRVRYLLHGQLGKLPKLEDIAAQLAMSPRSLHRSLANEHTSFSAQVDDWLARNAKEMLIARRLTVQQTADALGYAETSNFRRAFKRWYGCSPSQYILREQSVLAQH